tara:strand:- start:1959 stop:2639 length:681 start_codon:yes stop_codon:yes gene_type:complete
VSQIEQNLKRLRKKIFQETGSDKVKLVAATKTRSINEINEAISFGIVSVGENRVQEAEEKFQQIKTPTEKRFVGRLQSNKLKKATALFDTIDSVHSYVLAEKISSHCQALKKEQRILLQINTSKEPSKNGFLESEKKEILKCFSLKGIRIEGLMTVGPHTKNKKEIEEAFRSLRFLFLSVNGSLSKEKQMTELSMGMSDDFLIAIKEGATMVRVGTGIFGRRGLGA